MTEIERMTSHKLGPGFLGSTSFSAVYHEDANLKRLHTDSPLSEGHVEGRHRRLFLPNRTSQIRKGAACLALLEAMPEYQPLVFEWQESTEVSMIAPWIMACQVALKSQVYDPLMGSTVQQREQLLLDCAARIFENTLTELDPDGGRTIDRFACLFTTQKLRWEAVGMYFNAVGLAAMTTDEIGATRSRSSMDMRYYLGKQMLEASDTCLSLCEEIGQITDPFTWLACENMHLCTLVEGDASYMTWRRLGDLISACITRGLHGEIKVSHEVPFWLAELQKRTFAVAYNSDKSISAFLGRPPRLPRKYCVMQLPLDLRQGFLRLDPTQLEHEINKLDDHGWNTEGLMMATTYVRTHLICNMIGEDILELSLDALPQCPNNDPRFAEDILRRSRDAWDSFPSFITDTKANSGRVGVASFIADSIKLDFQYNEFLLQRAMVKRLITTNGELIRLSRAVLTTVLEILKKNISGQCAWDMPWIVAKYALPTAGVLGLELLSLGQGKQRSPLSLHRSEVIQNLSTLLAALKWVVTREDGNYEICSQARYVLQNILDVVLDPSQSTSRTATNGVKENGNMTSEQWFDQTRSEPDFWSMLPHHPLLADSRQPDRV